MMIVQFTFPKNIETFESSSWQQ